jgi:hypothetical protein
LGRGAPPRGAGPPPPPPPPPDAVGSREVEQLKTTEDGRS